MKLLLSLFVVLCNISIASAAVVSYTDSITSFDVFAVNTLGVPSPDSQSLPITTTTTRSGAYALPFFDSSLGELNQVTIQVDQTPQLKGQGYCNDDVNPNPDLFRSNCRHEGAGTMAHDFSLTLDLLSESTGPDSGGLGFNTESTLDKRVDNTGTIVGTALSDTYTFSGADILAFINSGMFDLDYSLIATSTLISASSTNFAQVQSIARLDGIAMVTYEYSPVPIPAAVWLFGTALVGFIGFGKRRKAT